MYFRDQHNHNSQPQLLDVILHTLDVLAFSLHFLRSFLVYWFFLHFCFFSFLGVEVFASKHGKKDVPRIDKQVWLFKSSKTSIWDTFVFGALPARVLQKARLSQKHNKIAQPHQPSQPRRHRQPPALQTSTVPIRMIFPRKTGQKSHKSLSEGCRAKHSNSERPQKHQQRASACVCITLLFPLA